VTGEEEENKRVLVAFAVWLGVTILVSELMDLVHRHLTEEDFAEAEATQALWDRCDKERAFKEQHND
ncbi:MAG: hypothetical protein M1167_00990, partial [Chloroflexi bacterium]|nr:hypothetical protein [Chloroflexota bacterium]